MPLSRDSPVMFHTAHEITVSWFALWTDWVLCHLLLYFFALSPKILFSLWQEKVLGFLTHFSPWLLLHRNHPIDWSWKLLSWFYHNATPNKNSLTVIAWISFNIIVFYQDFVFLPLIIIIFYWHTIRISYCHSFQQVPSQEINIMFLVS